MHNIKQYIRPRCQLLECVQVQSGIQIHFVGGVAKKAADAICRTCHHHARLGVNLRVFL